MRATTTRDSGRSGAIAKPRKARLDSTKFGAPDTGPNVTSKKIAMNAVQAATDPPTTTTASMAAAVYESRPPQSTIAIVNSIVIVMMSRPRRDMELVREGTCKNIVVRARTVTRTIDLARAKLARIRLLCQGRALRLVEVAETDWAGAILTRTKALM
jgi:hypothetical protein